MVHIPSDFEAPVVPELGEFERELDPAILAGRSRNRTQKVKETNIRKVLPDGCKVNAIAVHRASHWALSHRIDTSLPDGTQQIYFLKVLTGKLGQEIAQGEYEGDKEIHAIIPRNVPRPVTHGTYTKNSDRHFFLSTFHEMEDEMPSAQQFVSVVAELHQKSVSPTGKFGFHVTTHAGNYPLQNSWCDSWEEFFVRQLKTEIIWERGVQGQNDECCSKCGVVVFDDDKGDVLRPKARKETKESTRGIAEVTCRISRDTFFFFCSRPIS
jgi:protein-ribulosamine 3-kinase